MNRATMVLTAGALCLMSVLAAESLVSGAAAFNPQPEPPGKAANGQIINPATLKGFNPQPEPPGKTARSGFVNPGSLKGFNPQPEPPGRGKGFRR